MIIKWLGVATYIAIIVPLLIAAIGQRKTFILKNSLRQIRLMQFLLLIVLIYDSAFWTIVRTAQVLNLGIAPFLFRTEVAILAKVPLAVGCWYYLYVYLKVKNNNSLKGGK